MHADNDYSFGVAAQELFSNAVRALQDRRQSLHATASQLLHNTMLALQERRQHMREQWSSFFVDSMRLEKRIQKHSAIFQDLQERFNIFEIVSDTYYRENFHSDIIAYLLNPKQKHGLGGAPLRLFIRWLKNSQVKQSEQSKMPHTERLPDADSLRAVETMRERGRIDVLVEGETQCIIIENKINWAGDQPAQLQRYYEYVSQNNAHKEVCAVVYLTPDGHPPTPQSKGAPAREIDAVLYNMKAYPNSQDDNINMITGWLEPLLAYAIKTHNDIDVLSFLRQYIILLKKLGGKFMSDENAKVFLEEVLAPKKQGGEINAGYHEVARALCNHSIDIRDVTSKHLMRALRKDIGDNNTGLNHKFTVGQYGKQVVFFDFRLNEKRYGIDLIEFDWAQNYRIEIFYRDGNGRNIQLEDDDLHTLEKDILPSVINKYDFRLHRTNTRLCIGTDQYFQYVGNEAQYRGIIIEILKAFEAYAQKNNLEFVNN